MALKACWNLLLGLSGVWGDGECGLRLSEILGDGDGGWLGMVCGVVR